MEIPSNIEKQPNDPVPSGQPPPTHQSPKSTDPKLPNPNSKGRSGFAQSSSQIHSSSSPIPPFPSFFSSFFDQQPNPTRVRYSPYVRVLGDTTQQQQVPPPIPPPPQPQQPLHSANSFNQGQFREVFENQFQDEEYATHGGTFHADQVQSQDDYYPDTRTGGVRRNPNDYDYQP
ncbi:hypothetical protein L1987_18463 [Smallanthus sonchifolius]|uniref:Uncharacterized protein n=1 Tax=Smallanthus sonchifolius TaxID=185202 RepID=A0ACB9J392_9ASTR|nr:hypothetical protein L1987_18463 [Smallanthus sonchifolius]